MSTTAADITDWSMFYVPLTWMNTNYSTLFAGLIFYVPTLILGIPVIPLGPLSFYKNIDRSKHGFHWISTQCVLKMIDFPKKDPRTLWSLCFHISRSTSFRRTNFDLTQSLVESLSTVGCSWGAARQALGEPVADLQIVAVICNWCCRVGRHILDGRSISHEVVKDLGMMDDDRLWVNIYIYHYYQLLIFLDYRLQSSSHICIFKCIF